LHDLADGFDPLTGEKLPEDSVVCRPEVIRALNKCERILNRAKKNCVNSLNEEQHRAYQKLRKMRNDIADRKNVPRYRVLHDDTLMEIAIIKPSTPRHLSDIHGIGPKKLKDYGEEIIDVVGCHVASEKKRLTKLNLNLLPKVAIQK